MRKKTENPITEILKMIAPGTPIRDGLENILRAKTGALLLITDNNEIIKEENLRKCGVDECREQLMKIKGVGMKVANCVSLFGLGYREAFPVDVWIKRIMQSLYFDGKEHSNAEIESYGVEHFGKYGGYAQQYLFYYGKSEKIGLKNKTN